MVHKALLGFLSHPQPHMAAIFPCTHVEKVHNKLITIKELHFFKLIPVFVVILQASALLDVEEMKQWDSRWGVAAAETKKWLERLWKKKW